MYKYYLNIKTINPMIDKIKRKNFIRRLEHPSLLQIIDRIKKIIVDNII